MRFLGVHIPSTVVLDRLVYYFLFLKLVASHFLIDFYSNVSDSINKMALVNVSFMLLEG